MKIQILETIFKLDKKQVLCVLRGGGWFDIIGIAYSARRTYVVFGYRYRSVGFRLVQEI